MVTSPPEQGDRGVVCLNPKVYCQCALVYIYNVLVFMNYFFLLNNFTTINKIKNNTYGKNKMETTFSLKAKL